MHVFANWIKDFKDFELDRYKLTSVGYGAGNGYTDLNSALSGSASAGIAREMLVGNTLVFYRPAVGAQAEVRYMLLVSGGRQSLSAEFDEADRDVVLDPGPGKALWCMADSDPARSLKQGAITTTKQISAILTLGVKAGHFLTHLNHMKNVVHESVKTRYLLRIFSAVDPGVGNIIRLSYNRISSGDAFDAIKSDILQYMLGLN